MNYTDRVSDVSKGIIETLANEKPENMQAMVEWGAAMHRDGIVKGAMAVMTVTIIGNSLIYICKTLRDYRKSDARIVHKELKKLRKKAKKMES